MTQRIYLSRFPLCLALILGLAFPATARVVRFPASFNARQMIVTGGTQYVRVSGHGPAVLLLHGFGDTGDMWEPLAEVLVKDHTVIIPDLRGMGLSSHPESGYEKTAQAKDVAGIWTSSRCRRLTSLLTTSATWSAMP